MHFMMQLNRTDKISQRFVVVWDNVCFHRAVLVRNWYTNHKQFEVVYSPFLNPIEGFFRLEDVVYDRQPHARMPLLQAMEQACADIEVRSSMDRFGTQGEDP